MKLVFEIGKEERRKNDWVCSSAEKYEELLERIIGFSQHSNISSEVCNIFGSAHLFFFFCSDEHA